MVKPLTFKGDKKPSKTKRKRDARDEGADAEPSGSKKAARVVDNDNNNNNNNDDETDNDDGWVSADVVSDVSGPVVFVLPTEPVTALACDAIGKVFTIPVENIVDDNPATAEPHDVRMVWVANKIAGTENWRLKGHHGK